VAQSAPFEQESQTSFHVYAASLQESMQLEEERHKLEDEAQTFEQAITYMMLNLHLPDPESNPLLKAMLDAAATRRTRIKNIVRMD